MRVLGIDPGSSATGYAVVSRVRGRLGLEIAGVIRTRSVEEVAQRLLLIHTALVELIDQQKPDAIAIESIFRHRSSESALRLGQARGVALLAATRGNCGIYEYNPTTIKKTVGGHGAAGKPELVRVVQRLLKLEQALPADANDAAAIAMTHILHSAFADRVPRAAARRPPLPRGEPE